MKPACVPLCLIQGATFRQILRIMQSELAYRPITAIASTSPVRLTVDHALPTDWPVWVRGVTGFQALNKEFPRALPHLAQVVDAGHLDINPLAATGLLPKGGELSYYLPVDLTGVDATLMVLDAAGAELLSLSPTVHAGGWVEVLLTDEQTAALTWKEGAWYLDLEFPNGERYRAATGKATVYPAGTVPAGTCESAWVLTAGAQGVPGPMGPAFKVDAFGLLVDRDQYDDEDAGFAYLATDNGLLYLREGAPGNWTEGVPFQGPAGEDGRSITSVVVNGSGHLIITYSDGSTSDAGAVPTAPAVWGTIGGNLLDQDDLAAALDGKATAAQGAKADTAVQPADLTAALDGKVDKEVGKGLSQENFTSAEKTKLAGLESSHFKGVFASLAALQAALPTAAAGDYADVDAGEGEDALRYIWDVSDLEWVLSGSGAPLTAAQIKTLYESNPDTNAFTDAEKDKLAGVATGATKNATDAQLRDRATHTGSQAISTVTGLQAALDAGRANLLINGDFALNQRGFAGGALAAGSYGHDRWGAYNGGASYSVSGKTVTLASGSLCQVIESPGLAGETITVSVEDPSSTLTVTLGNGSGADSVSGSITAGSGRRGITLTVPAGVTGDLKVRLAGTTVAFKQVKLELGSVATPWLPPDRAIEQLRASRYFVRLTGNAGERGEVGLVTGAVVPVNFGVLVGTGVRLRATPTLSQSGMSVILEGEGSARAVTSFPASPRVSAAGVFVFLQVEGIAPAGGTIAGTIRWGASPSYIQLDAELACTD